MTTNNPPTICELLGEFTTTMLVTHGPAGLRARPMAMLEVEADGRIWFITSEDSAKAHEIEKNTHVHLVFQKDHDAFLSVNGHADLVKDASRVERLWSEEFRPFFPEGKTDPAIALIAVTPQDAEYWVHREPKVSGSWKAEDAYIHGTKPEAH